MQKTGKKEKVKQDIQAAAKQCFARYGLEKTTLDDIAAIIGLNKATLYYYYKNKEAIFLEVALSEAATYIQDLQAKTSQKKTTAQKILFYLTERVQYYMHVLNKNKISTGTLQKLLPDFFVLYDDMMQQEIIFIQSLLKQGIQNQELIKTDSARLASSLINMSDALKHSVEQQALLQGKAAADYSVSVQELRFLVQLIFNGLKPSV